MRDSATTTIIGRLMSEQNSRVLMANTGGHLWKQRWDYIGNSFVSRRSQFQRGTPGAQIAPVPLRAIKASSCAAIITNKNFFLHGAVLLGITIW
jgi:hypothetical protein